MNNVLSVQRLSWTIGNKKILDDINFDIEQGQFVGLIGPNGTGKSSLLRCLYRVNRPTQGSVTIFGKDIWQHSAKANARNVAVILQEHSDHLGLRVKDVIALGLTPHKKLFSLDTVSDRQQIEAAIAQVDLQSLREQPYQYLSGGEKQRVMVARAIVQNPQLLLMDEPTNHLDVHYQAEILQLVKRMNITVLASFHDLNLAATFCDKILVLSEGKLLAYGPPVEVLTSELLRDTFHIQALVDPHPLYPTPRITYAYKE